MQRHKLRLNALRAFEVAARRGSLTAAADELHVTHSAISHHVTALEADFGLALFVRDGRNIRLTDAGQMLLPVLNQAFDNISAAVDGLHRGQSKRTISVTLTPSFAAKWLVPRLGRFRTRAGDAEVRLHPSLELVDFRNAPFDVGIRTGAGTWPDLHAIELMPIHLTPMCSPALVEGPKALRRAKDLQFQTLIHADVGSVGVIGTEWKQWLDAAGIEGIDHTHGYGFHDPGLAIQAAIDGQGVAVSYLELASADIAAGRLVLPFELRVKHQWSYYLVGSRESVENPLVVQFQTWLDEEARA